VPVLRKEFASGRPAEVPAAPTHASLLRAQQAGASGTGTAGTSGTGTASANGTKE
jgi:hypothetical protein